MGGYIDEFIVGLPLTARRHDSICVVAETLTKSAHFIPVRTTYQAPDLVRVFISEIVGCMAYLKRLYPIEDRCLLDDFGLVSKRPWEPSLTLVLRITQRRTDRQNVLTKP
jgi:hypothetical protein